MPETISIILIVIFSIHLVVFLSLYLRRNQVHHLFFVLVFLFLVLANVLRVWWPHWGLFGHATHLYLRVAAWSTTAIAVFFWVKQKRALKK